MGDNVVTEQRAAEQQDHSAEQDGHAVGRHESGGPAAGRDASSGCSCCGVSAELKKAAASLWESESADPYARYRGR